LCGPPTILNVCARGRETARRAGSWHARTTVILSSWWPISCFAVLQPPERRIDGQSVARLPDRHVTSFLRRYCGPRVHQDGGQSLRRTTEDSEKVIETSGTTPRCDHLRRHIGDVAGAQEVGRLERFVNVVGSCNVVSRLGSAELTCRCRGFAAAISCHAAVAMSRGTVSVLQRCIGQRCILVR